VLSGERIRVQYLRSAAGIEKETPVERQPRAKGRELLGSGERAMID
jgi:hypothetical protein